MFESSWQVSDDPKAALSSSPVVFGSSEQQWLIPTLPTVLGKRIKRMPASEHGLPREIVEAYLCSARGQIELSR